MMEAALSISSVVVKRLTENRIDDSTLSLGRPIDFKIREEAREPEEQAEP